MTLSTTVPDVRTAAVPLARARGCRLASIVVSMGRLRAVLVGAVPVLASALALASASAEASFPARHCSPPRGPGDNLVHSANLQVRGVSCSQGRAVALSCNKYFTARHCTALGYRWWCFPTK